MNPIAPSSVSLGGMPFDEIVARQRVKERFESTSSTTSTQPTSKTTTPKISAEELRLRQVAQDFEAVFLRQMLSSLERTTKVSSQGNNIAGQGTYGSMIVDAVSEAVAKAGGLGISDVLAKSMAEHLHGVDALPGKTSSTDPGAKLNQTTSASRPTTNRAALSEDERISPQGLAVVAVPRTEIRTSAVPIKGPLADRRIR